MFNVHIGLTNVCNLNCKHCYIKEKNELFYDLIDETILIDCINRIGSSIVTYTCGENLLYKNFYSFAKRIREKGLYQILISNGTLINSNIVVNKLEKCGINCVCISLDSSSRKKHDENRGKPGTFDAAINALKLIENNGTIRPLLTTCVSSFNIHELFEILSIGQQIGVNSFSFMRERHLGGLSSIHKDYYDEMKKIIIYSYINNLDIHIHDYTLNPIINNLYQSKQISKALHDKLIDMNNCHIYKKLLLITPCGNVYPCVFSPHHIGNIYKDSLTDIFSKKTYQGFCRIKGDL